MTAPGRALLDTSVLIETESGRRIDEAALPEEAAVSVVTLAELRAGVLRAPDSEARGRRMATLERVASMDDDFDPLDGARGLVVVRV